MGLRAAVAVAFALEATLFSFESPVVLRRQANRSAPASRLGRLLPCAPLSPPLGSSISCSLAHASRCSSVGGVWLWMTSGWSSSRSLADAEAVGVAGSVEHHEIRVGLRRVAKSPVKQDLCRFYPVTSPCVRVVTFQNLYQDSYHARAALRVNPDACDEFLVHLLVFRAEWLLDGL